ncbi:MAG TPA: AAA family ATPase, partial [Acidimicrobiales bacterium]
WVDNFAELTNFASVLDRHVLAAVEMRALAYLDGRCHLLEGRVAHGHIVDGHGDLLTDDIFCLSDGPRILDCLEFDPRLRAGDVLLDLAFLAMDLEHLGRPDLAVALVDTYCELSAEHHPRSLAHHYIAYRALVRAKVSCLRALQAAQSTAPAAAFLDLCARHLHAGAVRLVLVGGLPGTGKTTLAGELGKRLGWVVLRSDEVRKELAGLDALTPSAAPYQEGLYTPAMTARTYSTMLERAEVALGLGESVVLDASWGDASDRDAARTVASRASAELVEVVCELDEATAARRIGGRGPDASDATPAVAHAMAAAFAPWPEAQRADTGATAAEVASAVLALMGLEGPSNS